MSNAGEYADLADIEAIRQLKARYFRTMDQKDWEGYRQVFTVDVAIDTTDDTGPGSATCRKLVLVLPAEAVDRTELVV